MARKLSNWLLAYRDYTAGTESPESYHIWAGISTIAAAAQRKIRFEMGHIKAHSNLMVIFVGPAGGPRKTTALDIARNLIKDPDEICLESYGIKLELAPEKASGASLIARMARITNKEHQSLTAYVGELGTLFGGKDSDVQETILNFWDCRADFVKETRMFNVEAINAPWFNMIAATTPIWLSENLKPSSMEGGFVSRGLFVYEAQAGPPQPLPYLTKEQRQLRHFLVHDLAEISKLAGNFVFDQEAEDLWKDWYVHTRNERPKDPRFATQHTRKPINVQKVAMALSLAESDELEITAPTLQTAIDLVTDLQYGMAHAFLGVGKNPFAREYEAIKEQISKAGRMHYKHLLSLNIGQLDKMQIDQILMTLVQAEEIIREGQVFHSRSAA